MLLVSLLRLGCITGPDRGCHRREAGSDTGRTPWSERRPPPSWPPEPLPRCGRSWDTQTPVGWQTRCFIFSVLLWRHSNGGLKVNWTYCSRQAEDRLFGHQSFSEVHIVFKVRKVAHFNPYLYQCADKFRFELLIMTQNCRMSKGSSHKHKVQFLWHPWRIKIHLQSHFVHFSTQNR